VWREGERIKGCATQCFIDSVYSELPSLLHPLPCQLLLQYYSINEGKITSYIVSQAGCLARLESLASVWGGGGYVVMTCCCSYCYIAALSLDGVGL
jgi:hypothetical protein